MSKSLQLALLLVATVGSGPTAGAEDASFHIVDEVHRTNVTYGPGEDELGNLRMHQTNDFAGFWVEGLPGIPPGTVVISPNKLRQRVLLGEEVQPGRYVGYCMDRGASAPTRSETLTIAGRTTPPRLTSGPQVCVQLGVWARSGDLETVREHRARCQTEP